MKLEKDTSKFDDMIKKYLTIEKQIDGALQSVVYPFLFRGDTSKQAERWETKGASEGKPWRPLNSNYAAKKLLKYKSYPGAGTKLLVATGRLLAANTGRPKESGDFRKLIQNGVLYVSIGLPYGSDVNKERDFTTFSHETYVEMKYLIKNYFSRALKP